VKAAGGRSVSAGDRAALLRKYRVLARWRRAKDRAHAPGRRADAPPEEDAAEREPMRALAAEFPGALRELDRLGAAELERRVEVLSRVGEENEDENEPWVAWILAYHRELGRVLAEKRAGRPGSPSPDGRASLAVLRTIAERFRLPAEEIANALFPPRRRW
jgi:hypothetical protein